MFGLFKKNKENNSDYLFKDAPDTACFTCRHIVTEGRAILSVTHDQDDTWQFLCGEDHVEEDAKIISLKQITAIDPSLNELHAMPQGVGAEREKKNAEWKPYKLEQE